MDSGDTYAARGSVMVGRGSRRMFSSHCPVRCGRRSRERRSRNFGPTGRRQRSACPGRRRARTGLRPVEAHRAGGAAAPEWRAPRRFGGFRPIPGSRPHNGRSRNRFPPEVALEVIPGSGPRSPIRSRDPGMAASRRDPGSSSFGSLRRLPIRRIRSREGRRSHPEACSCRWRWARRAPGTRRGAHPRAGGTGSRGPERAG